MTTVLHAFIIGLSLIVAIGAQNVFIIREGLRGGYVYSAGLISALCDCLLIATGIVLVSRISQRIEWFDDVLRIGAVCFLLYYAGNAFFNALRKAPVGWAQAEAAQGQVPGSRKRTIGLAFAFALVNPHVYLDTFVVLGGMGAAREGMERVLFWLGASLASFVWFMGTGLLSRRLAPVLQSERSGRLLDGAIGTIVLVLAGHLLMGVWEK
ncbi:LysE/ArgO family amino acid transporter [Pararhodospirillum oryzae]|nr:LysE family transporter [Pararhodospirillum oryzae]